MKVLVTGANGQLGSDVVSELKSRKIECMGCCREDFDICDRQKTSEYITKYMPDAVIHCAAYTAVDKAEDEQELCYNVNVIGTENIAKVCREINCKMLYISTDYVFNGEGTDFFEIDSKPDSQNFYGKTKYLGEQKVIENLKKFFIVRISWVFGHNGSNFVKTMLRLALKNDTVNVVADQIGSPTFTEDLSELLCDMIVTDSFGVYHATNEGTCSWALFAEKIFEYSGLNVKVNNIKSSEYKTKAKRPKNSRLSKKSLTDNGFRLLPVWQDALKRYLGK